MDQKPLLRAFIEAIFSETVSILICVLLNAEMCQHSTARQLIQANLDDAYLRAEASSITSIFG